MLLKFPFSISGTIRSLHHSQHSCTVDRMCIPSLHVIDAATELSHLLHAFHELLRSKLLQEEVTSDEESRVKVRNCVFAF